MGWKTLKTGVFVNKFSKNATFYRRISPTSFYPMLAGIATEAQAERMMGVLTSPEHFSVSEGGAGNTDNAFWPMPSIAASDPAFPALGYWRGFVWGPQIQLTYWALQHPAYANVAAVQTAKKALAAHSNEMFLSVWRGWRHVCENYSPRRYAAGGNTTTTSKCTGDFTYHWGGLAGFVQILEAGLY
jgi:putative isomerase